MAACRCQNAELQRACVRQSGRWRIRGRDLAKPRAGCRVKRRSSSAPRHAFSRRRARCSLPTMGGDAARNTNSTAKSGGGQRTTEGASMLFIFHCRASWLAQRISCRSTSVPIFAGLWGPIRPRAGVLSTPRQCLQRGAPDWVVSARGVSLTPLTRCACSAKAVMSRGSTHVTAAQSTAREHHYTP